MSKFKVGDKVRIVFGDGWIEWVNEMRKFIGETATISEVSYKSEHPWFKIEGHFFHWNECDAELIEQPRREFIVIHRSGAETIAELRHDREVIKSGKAICNTSDTFDFDTGAKLAFDRLMGREEPKPKPKNLFKVGDRVVTSIGHGEIVQVDPDIIEGNPYWIEYDNGTRYWKNSAEAKLEPKPAPQPAHRFKVGDRVVTSYGVGYVKQVDNVNNDGMPYCIKYDFGCALWSRSGEAKAAPAPAPEPPKFYTGKVVCVEDLYHKPSRVGMIFEFVDGQLQGNNKRMSDFTVPKYESFEQFARARNAVKWIEVKSDV